MHSKDNTTNNNYSREKEEHSELNYEEYAQSVDEEEKVSPENLEFIEYLYDSLNGKKELNFVLAGYFNKINSHLLYNRKEKVIILLKIVYEFHKEK